MTDTNDAAVSGSEPAPIAVSVLEHKAGGDGPLSPRDAARSVTDWRRKGSGAAVTDGAYTGHDGFTGARADPATPAHESTEVDAAPLEEATGETTEPDPAEEPPLERPRSWTKEQDDHWKALPRSTQEYLIDRASKDSEAVRKAQNEAAEHRKVTETERQRLATLASQYESALPNLVNTLQQAQAQNFPEIKTIEDVRTLQREDPLKFQEWQVHQMQLGAAQRELEGAQQRQWTESRDNLKTFQERETARLFERVPELSDKDTRAKMMSSAQQVFDDLGFKPDEMKSLWEGDAGISLHDHRFQMLVLDGIRYRELQQQKAGAEKTVKEKIKQLPPVQKPGTAQGKGAAAEQQIANLKTRVEGASGRNALLAAADLLRARRAAAKR